jgi:hypothetical protein
VGAKLILLPLAVYALGTWVFGLPPLWIGVATIFAAMPTGIKAYLFATRYQVGAAATSSRHRSVHGSVCADLYALDRAHKGLRAMKVHSGSKWLFLSFSVGPLTAEERPSGPRLGSANSGPHTQDLHQAARPELGLARLGLRLDDARCGHFVSPRLT